MESMEYILERVQKIPRGCWVWKLSVNSWGYGRVRSKGRFGERQAHRIAYRAFIGPIPEEMCVLHKCDNPRCCNPKHLYIGTNQDNSNDAVARKRTWHPRGQKCGMAKLTEIAVREIRSSGDTVSSLARKFHVSRRAIGFAKRGVTWAL